MEKIFEVSIIELLENPEKHKPSIIRTLESLWRGFENPTNRNSVTIELFVHLKSILEKISQDSEICLGILRVFRNAVVNCPANQNFLWQCTAIAFVIKNLLETETAMPVSPSSKAMALQVIGNSIVCNLENSKTLLQDYSSINWIGRFFEHGVDDKVSDYAAMVGLTLTQCQPVMTLEAINSTCVRYLIDHVNLEFVVLWLESLSSLPGFVIKIYPELDSSYKVKFTHILSGIFSSPFQIFPIDDLKFLILNFKNLADQILPTNFNGITDEFNVLEVTATVELFCKTVLSTRLGNIMKSDRSFVASTSVLLRTIHEIGTTGENCFTPIEKVEKVKDASSKAQSEPGFLFKADLIRLLGSLVEGDKINQDQVRDLGLLPVILNCTKIDGRNPFIPQCSIVTLKFLLDANSENQLYIKELEKNK